MYYRGILILLGLSLLTWMLSTFGLLHLPEGAVYDFFVQLTPKKEVATKNILLITAKRQNNLQDEKQWLNLVKELQSLKAKQIVFSFFPEGAGPGFYLRAEKAQNIILGRSLDNSAQNFDTYALQKLPEKARGHDLAWGVTALPPVKYGIARRQHLFFELGEKQAPSLVARAAAARGRSLPKSEYFYVNFNGRSQGLARISLAQVLEGRLVPEFVQGKSVLIGFEPDPLSVGLSTPLSSGQNGISLLTYQGYALDTLLAEKEIVFPPSWVNLLCILAVAGIGLVIYQLLSFGLAFWFTAISLIFYLLLSWVLLFLVLIWPPVLEIVFTQVLLFVLLLRSRQIQDAQKARNTLAEMSKVIRPRIIPEGFLRSQEYWNHVVNMVNQTLNLKRSIFLEKVEGDHRVKEVASLNCSLEDIQERRRDFERTPYTTALEEAAPVKVEKYLQKGDADELQYLVPLYFGGKVEGFWAFGIADQIVQTKESFLRIASNFAEEIALMLAQRRERKQSSELEHSLWRQILSLQAGKFPCDQAESFFGMVSRRMSLLEGVLQTTKTGILVYDLAGSVIHVNKTMSDYLKNKGLHPFELTASDLVSKLCAYELDTVRGFLQEVVLDQESLDFFLSAQEEGTEQYMLSLHPIIREENTNQADEHFPFRIFGIQLELIDLSPLRDVVQRKEDLVKVMKARMARDLQELDTEIQKIAEDSVDTHHDKEIQDFVLNKIRTIQENQNELNKYLDKSMLVRGENVFPLRPSAYLKQVTQENQSKLKSKGISLEEEIKDEDDLVLAEPEHFSDLLRSLFAVLIQDATEESVLRVKLYFDKGYACLEMENSGFGMPNSSLQDAIFSSHVARSRDYENIHDSLRYIENWGAKLEPFSEVGQGISFRLFLKLL